MGSKLDRPLGQDRGGGARRPRLPGWRVALGLSCAALVVAGSLYTALLPENVTEGGAAPASGTVSAGAGQAAKPQTSRERPKNGMSAAVAEKAPASDGVTVTRLGPAGHDGSGPLLIQPKTRAGQDPHLATRPEPGLYEDTKYGPLPVRGAGGARAMDVYAGPDSGDGGTRVAIVVGGLGLSQTGTLNAIESLPEGVTLAFAATGNSLQRWMQAARRAGHEILLQVPMEPFGYPGVNPGPHTLTVAGGKNRELADLHYAMGRLTNYTGIMNYMGGRFMADAQSMEPVMQDVGRRGLFFLDDGSSAQSLAGKLAGRLAVPFARADLQIDADGNPGAILKKLDELEQIARRKGSAIGVASAFDTSVQAIAAWDKDARARGVDIVGVSALASDPGQATAGDR